MAPAAQDLPFAVSWRLTSRSRLSSGPTVAESVETADAAVPGTVAWHALNCSHPFEFGPALEPGSGRSAYVPSVQMPWRALCKLGHLEDGDTVELGRQMGELARRFPDMDSRGGCCGTDLRHLAEIVRNVQAIRASA